MTKEDTQKDHITDHPNQTGPQYLLLKRELYSTVGEAEWKRIHLCRPFSQVQEEYEQQHLDRQEKIKRDWLPYILPRPELFKPPVETQHTDVNYESKLHYFREQERASFQRYKQDKDKDQ